MHRLQEVRLRRLGLTDGEQRRRSVSDGTLRRSIALRSTAALAGPSRDGKVDDHATELTFPLAHQGGITCVVVPFTIVDDFECRAEGWLHVMLRNSIVFHRESPRYLEDRSWLRVDLTRGYANGGSTARAHACPC